MTPQVSPSFFLFDNNFSLRRKNVSGIFGWVFLRFCRGKKKLISCQRRENLARTAAVRKMLKRTFNLLSFPLPLLGLAYGRRSGREKYNRIYFLDLPCANVNSKLIFGLKFGEKNKGEEEALCGIKVGSSRPRCFLAQSLLLPFFPFLGKKHRFSHMQPPPHRNNNNISADLTLKLQEQREFLFRSFFYLLCLPQFVSQKRKRIPPPPADA